MVYLSEKMDDSIIVSLLLRSTSGTDDPAASACSVRLTSCLICMHDAASPRTESCSGAFTQRSCKTVNRLGHHDQCS